MKKALSLLFIITVLTCMLSACAGKKTQGDLTASAPPTDEASTMPAPTATPEPVVIDASTVDYSVEIWNVCELEFQSSLELKPREWNDIVMDAVFTNRETGTTLTIPSFWDGKNIFRVRFAPTECGIWDFVTVCEADEAMNGKTGTVGSSSYTGDVEIYKRGFIKTELGTKYFMYNDGTPFYYLGDTHWNFLNEEFDSAGDRACGIQTDSHFKYIVDKRVSQGFTVYQSEPISDDLNLADGWVSNADLLTLKKADLKFQYIAEKGLVHSNAEMFFVSDIKDEFIEAPEKLELLCRYWVARFGAYPVIWSLAQEVDNDNYIEWAHERYNYTNNPWVRLAEYIHKYDAYNHPLSGHQENANYTTVTGLGTKYADANSKGWSAFYSAEVSKATGHSWWAAQWTPSLTEPLDHMVTFDYWNSNKVAICYESSYCYLSTKDEGARKHAWIEMLSGFAGVGYGAEDIWLYKSLYLLDELENDGLTDITPEDKRIYWGKSIEFESGYQMGYMRQFFETLEWYRLVPMFNEKTYFTQKNEELSVGASIGNTVMLRYFYGQTLSTGTFNGMDVNAEYQLTWYNTRDNSYVEIGKIKCNDKGSYSLPDKPDKNDWLIIAKKL